LAVPCILQPNECSVHDGRLMHGSEPNTSGLRRCGWTLRFVSADVKMAKERLPYHNMYLARGRNLTGQQLADPTKAYPEMLEQRINAHFRMH
jgi:ectoine hydroxylase-related dioxygenase (phytanoyl-CoA dioxygenase family)